MRDNWDQIFSIIHYVEGAVGISLNVLLIYLTIFVHTPAIREYRVLLGNAAVTDLITTIAILLVQPRMICIGMTYAYIALGPSKNFGAKVSYIILGLNYNMLFYLFLLFPIAFGFRYYILVRPIPTIRTLILLCCGLYLISLGQFVKTPSAIVQNDLQQRIPVYNLSGEVVFGSILPRNPLGIISSVIIFLPMFPIYGLVFYVRHKVHEFIDDDTRHNFSEVVKKGHKKLMLALTVHAALPAIFVFVPFGLMLCYHIGIMRFILFEYLVFTMFALLPIARPIVNLTFVRPYNKALRHMITGNLCVHKMQIQDVSHYTNINGKRVSIKR
ncbi:unnamed protein product [Toxocara canis]|uniref:G_PROTEIN_RECEP_F1_2 domain-containing protein n=1 Tax=Toxocara canis TaxID=6265 RepID=A0A183VA03_TOXCA|nr:unnamed protein product [Toxocara canis]